MDSPQYEPVIGLEIHAQLLSRTKLFCGCSTGYGNPPNSLVCPVCLGLPGALPVLNEAAVAMAVKMALSVQATVHLRSEFSRKNYFYPDLPKGYQITQFGSPLASGGYLKIETNGTSRTCGIERLHLEEDAGKSIHLGAADSSKKTRLDFNRSGIPLLEIVGKPEIRSPEDAVGFLKLLRTTLQYLEICDGNMEEGSLRCDANISVGRKGSEKPGVKTEIKNLNSFRFLQKALEYETRRQMELLQAGKPVIQETRFWDSRKNRTLTLRSKEEAHDYRYFSEPDLPPLILSENFVNAIKDSLPELPWQKMKRFISQYKLSRYEAGILTSSRKLADYFEKTARASRNPKQASRWIMREVLQHLKEKNIEADQFPLSAGDLAGLIDLVEKKEVTLRSARENIFPEMIRSGRKAGDVARKEGISQISDEGQIRKIIEEAVGKNPKPLKQFLEGKTKVAGFFVGQVMKETKGSANPELVNTLLKEVLERCRKRRAD